VKGNTNRHQGKSGRTPSLVLPWTKNMHDNSKPACHPACNQVRNGGVTVHTLGFRTVSDERWCPRQMEYTKWFLCDVLLQIIGNRKWLATISCQVSIHMLSNIVLLILFQTHDPTKWRGL
jgi:hypothetical protein